MSSFDINNHHHHKTSSITITANYYYCYCCCCCCCWGCDDTYYWVYLSSDHAFQVYYKVQQVFLQSATAYFITKGDGLLFQSATAFFYKVRQVFLKSATGITKCDNFISMCDRYYKVRQNSPSSETQGQLVRTTECSWWKITVRSRQAIKQNEHSIVPTSFPWVSEDGLGFTVTITNERCNCQWSLRALSICQNWQARPFPWQW